MRFVFKPLSLCCLAFLLGGAAQCRPVPEDRESSFAVKAGQSTVVLGSSCQRGLSLGYGACQLTRGTNLPNLQILFMNDGEYLVSDCQFGILKSGSAKKGELVDVDLAALQSWVDKNSFCLLKVEAVESYPDPGDSNQLRKIPIAGGFFIEALDPGYIPVPTPDLIAWCYQVERTTKGRTVVKGCP